MASSVLERLSSAFQIARDNEIAKSGESLEPAGIVFHALVEAMETLKALPDPESGWLYSQGFWPQIVHDHDEQIENYKDMLRRIVSGEESADVLLRKRPPSTAAIGRMDAIFDVFPKCLVGRDRSRDWKLLCFLASGRSTRVTAKLLKCGCGRIGERRDLQTQQIARKLVDLMPAPIADGAPQRPVYRIDRAA